MGERAVSEYCNGKGVEKKEVVVMKREKCLGVMLFVFLAWAGPVLSESEVKDCPKVEIGGFIGKKDRYLEPTKFPVFSEGRCKENQKCSNRVEANLSGLNRQKAADDGKLVLKAEDVPGQYMMAQYGVSDARCYGPGEFDFETGRYHKADKSTGGGWISLGNSEYTVLEFEDKEENVITVARCRDTAKLHFTWMVRVEGEEPNSYQCFSGKEVSSIQMRPLFCSSRHSCSMKQDFSGGQVKMQLYIKGEDNNGNVIKAVKAVKAEDGTVSYDDYNDYDEDQYAPLDPITEMTLPSRDAITSRTESTPGDPTVTGSLTITKDDFGSAELPEKIYFKLMWYNDSPVVAESLGNQRNLTVMLVPITDSN